MRRWLTFAVEGDACAASLDEAAGTHGLLIVSGGNEIRSGAHRGMADLAARIAAAEHPVLRFDRRGVGDSTGTNGGFRSSGPDIAAAIALFRSSCPQLRRITAFGNCDAASALVLHVSADGGGIDSLILANPWILDPDDTASPAPALPPAAAIRARYAAKLRDPREWRRMLTGGVNLVKLARGLRSAAHQQATPQLAAILAQRLAHLSLPVTILLAERDGTALAFAAAWQTPIFAGVRQRVIVHRVDSASHSFADDSSRAWLESRIRAELGGRP